MKKFFLPIVFALFSVAQAFAYKSDEQLQKEEDEAGLIGIIITIVIFIVAYMARGRKDDK
ncbi:MAG: hypothetical protein PUE39_06690 [bacterium]|nr:hypothetical protein [bacterium]